MTRMRPKGVTFIGYFYILGSIALLLSLILGTDQDVTISLRFVVPHILVAILCLVISFGYLTLKKWGFGLMLLYSLISFIVSLRLAVEYNTQPFGAQYGQ